MVSAFTLFKRLVTSYIKVLSCSMCQILSSIQTLDSETYICNGNIYIEIIYIYIYIYFYVLFRVNVHTRSLPDSDSDRIPKFFFNGINMTVWENDIAILKISGRGDQVCGQRECDPASPCRHIRPACLPKKVWHDG